MGGHIVNYDSMLVLTHFKGHAMGGFWRLNEEYRHWLRRRPHRQAAGSCRFDVNLPWDQWPGKEMLMETMAGIRQSRL